MAEPNAAPMQVAESPLPAPLPDNPACPTCPTPACPTVTLAWDPNFEATLDHYTLYAGSSSGNHTRHWTVAKDVAPGVSPPQVNKQISLCDDTQPGVVYLFPQGSTTYWVVTASDASGLESDPSNEITYVIPQSNTPAGGIPGPAMEYQCSVSNGVKSINVRYRVATDATNQNWPLQKKSSSSAVWTTVSSTPTFETIDDQGNAVYLYNVPIDPADTWAFFRLFDPNAGHP